MKIIVLTLVVNTGLTSALCAGETDLFVESNLLGIFYHELGHALIDLEQIPIFGQEEDAADTFSIFLIDSLFDEPDAEAIAFDAAIGFWAEAQLRSENEETPHWWDVHGPDEQRFFNTVCLFYGANPEKRQGYADDLELPQERAESCAGEYDQANHSWGSVLDSLSERNTDHKMTITGHTGSLTYQLIEVEVKTLNESFSLSDSLNVDVRACDEANAFYDPVQREIVMCTEFEWHLYELGDR